MEAVAARCVAVVVHIVARHRMDLTGRVVEATGVLVPEVRAHRLVGEEATVLGDGQVGGFEEQEQFPAAGHRGVRHEVVEELAVVFDRQTLAEEQHQLVGKVAGDLAALVGDAIVGHRDVAARRLLDEALDGRLFKRRVIVASLEGLDHGGEVDMRGVDHHRIAARREHGQGVGLENERDHNLLLLSISD